MNMSNNFIDNIKNKLKNIKEENNNYNNLIETSTIFENLTIGYILRIIWWPCCFIIGLAVISVLFDD